MVEYVAQIGDKKYSQSCSRKTRGEEVTYEISP
jgi:hypothetical protein